MNIKKVHGRLILREELLSGVSSSDDGVWAEVSPFTPFSIDISGIGSATAQIRCSNDASRPADNTHGRQAGTDITTDGLYGITEPVRWVKVRISAYTSGTINANMEGVSPAY